jgi:hypothetical protein
MTSDPRTSARGQPKPVGWSSPLTPPSPCGSLELFDSDTERFVFRAVATEEGIALVGDDDDLDELMGYVVAEANHENDRRSQRRLDDAFEVLARAMDGPPRP